MSAVLAVAQEASFSASEPEIWLNRHGDYLYRFAMFRLRDPLAAEDVVQETLLAALQSRNSFACLSTERTWLAGILKHKVMDYFRQRSRAVTFNTADDEWGENDVEFFDQAGEWKDGARPGDWNADPLTLLERKEFWESLYQCLNLLPRRTASAFILREIDGLSSEEICAHLNITPNNLWVMLHRARLHLRQALERSLLSSSPTRTF
jgi:RNA polymerase sigma-70 factor, ECF subfamily